MLTLYQTEWCPYCHRVRQVLSELRLTYVAVNVPSEPTKRGELMALSGQDTIPVLTDGDRMFRDSDDIIRYLHAAYPAPDDAQRTADLGAWRDAQSLSSSPRVALARLRELLVREGFAIVSQVRGPKISEHLPKEYVLLHAAVPVAAAKAVELDALAASAVVLPVAIIPVEGGNSVVAAADPVGQVWLYGDSELIRLQTAVRKRLAEVLDKL